MIDDRLLTAEDFANELLDLPEGGRWHELHAGRTVMLHPPDEVHGNIVLHFSRAYAEWASRQAKLDCFACFDLSLIVRRQPDTVISPAVSFFTEGSRFAEAEKLISDTKPRLVLEIASTKDRRDGISQRVETYHTWGVDCVWVADPETRTVNEIPNGGMLNTLTANQSLRHQELLGDFEVPINDLFENPEWWG